MTKTVCRFGVVGLVVALLVAGAASASAQGLRSQRTLGGGRRPQMQSGRSLQTQRPAQEMMREQGWSEEQIKEATGISDKLGGMENRLKRILDEPCPTELADISFSNAVMMAKGGDPGGYFALALHYGGHSDVVVHDGDKAWNLLKKSADMGCPIGALFLAMAEELRIYECREYDRHSRTYHGECKSPNFYPYVTNRNVRPTFDPLFFKTNDFGRVTLVRRCSAYAEHNYIRHDYHNSCSCYSVTNSEEVAHVRKLYEKAIALGCSGARGELARFEEAINTAKAQVAEQVAKHDRISACQRAHSEFAEAMLGIPIESKLSHWRKAEEVRAEAEKHRLPNLEERVKALEKRFGKTGW